MPDHCLCNKTKCKWPLCDAADTHSGADLPADRPSPCGDAECAARCQRDKSLWSPDAEYDNYECRPAINARKRDA